MSDLTKIKNKQLLINSEFDINNNRLINISNPINDNDAVNKGFLENMSLNNALGTGLYIGGLLSIVNSDHFRINNGIGFIVNIMTKEIIKIIWNDIIYIPIIPFGENVIISVGIDIDNNIIQKTSPFTSIERNNYIVLGELFIHPIDGILHNVSFQPILSRDLPSIVDIFLNDNPKNISGNIISVLNNSLKLNCSNGISNGYSINSINSLLNTNEVILNNVSPIMFNMVRFNGSRWIYDDVSDELKPEFWSNGTPSLQLSSPTKYNIRLLIRSVTMNEFFLIYLTQNNEYDSIIEAKSSLSVNIPKELMKFSIPLCFIIIRSGVTDLYDPEQFEIVSIESISNTSATLSYAYNVIFDQSLSKNLNDTNVQNALVSINNKIESLDYSYANLNMFVNIGTGIFKACDIPIIDKPTTLVKIELNGIPVILGNGIKTEDCYFSGDDGMTARTYDNIHQGDFLFWNNSTSTYHLELDDKIDFIYMVIEI